MTLDLSKSTRAQIEADIINALPARRPFASLAGAALVRASAMTGSLLASPAAAKFHPTSWSAGERRLRGKIIG